VKKSIVVAAVTLLLLPVLLIYREELLFACTQEVCYDMGAESDPPRKVVGPTKCKWPWQKRESAAEKRKKKVESICQAVTMKLATS
jgi:hypothetical protein